MNVIIFGATGFIGKRLHQKLIRSGYNVIAVSRNVEKAIKILGNNSNSIKLDINKPDQLINSIEKSDFVINLAGENIGQKKWTKKQRNRIIDSRTSISNTITNAILKAKSKPKKIIQASAIGYYPFSLDKKYNEKSSPGNSFLSKVTKVWEASINDLKKSPTTLIKIRTGIVLDNKNGILGKMLTPFKNYLGNIPGSGKQWLSWIHIDDAVNAIVFIMENESNNEIYNLTAPYPVRMNEFCKQIGKTINKPVWFHVPEFLLKLFLGKMAEELILSGQYVMPDELLESGFLFKYPKLQNALSSILNE